MSSVITTQAIAALASQVAHGAAALAGSCKSVAILAGHKISLGATTYALPAVKLAWIKFAAIAMPAVQFLGSPLGLSLIGVGVGAFTATVGVTLIVTSQGDKLKGDENKLVRRAILCSGVALGVIGVVAGVAGGVGIVAVLV